MAAYHCCVPQCPNDSRYDPFKKLSFHKIPEDDSLREEWIAMIRRDVGQHFKITDATKVCSAHFKPEDFVKAFGMRRKLKQGVVPSLFQCVTSKKERLGPQRRRRKQELPMRYDGSQDTQAVPDDHNYVDLRTCMEKLENANQRIEYLEGLLERKEVERFGIERITPDPHLLNFYTGFSDYETFKAAFRSIEPTTETLARWGQVQRHKVSQIKLQGDVFKNETLPLIDQFLLFLCRVRVGLFEQDLALRFNVPLSTVSRILLTWTNYLYFVLGSLLVWPPQHVIQQQMPECFKVTYPKTRVLLDFTEVKVQRVSNSGSYSSYKSHTTSKGLIGITPSGTVSFVSVLYTRSILEKAITKKSGILDMLEQGDQVVVETNFPIDAMLQEIGCSLVIPHVPRGQVPLEAQETARLRMHIDQAIQRVKEYHIFDAVIPLSLAGTVNQLWTVCCLLTNLRGPLHSN